MVVFLQDYESFLADLIFENGKYKIALDGSSECLDKKFYNDLTFLKKSSIIVAFE